MNWPAFEQQLRKQNPKLFEAKKVQMTPDTLLLQLRRAYDAGHGEAVEQAEKAKSLFERVFG